MSARGRPDTARPHRPGLGQLYALSIGTPQDKLSQSELKELAKECMAGMDKGRAVRDVEATERLKVAMKLARDASGKQEYLTDLAVLEGRERILLGIMATGEFSQAQCAEYGLLRTRIGGLILYAQANGWEIASVRGRAFEETEAEGLGIEQRGSMYELLQLINVQKGKTSQSSVVTRDDGIRQ